ncbi:MAG: T9SS type A sorting domain-containing protein [Parabacteroides distasonis]|nr:T9SS type A sorting domain-containing protein [Parabacteroides distasonis]
MNKYVTFKRTALLMLMFLMAWCLPMKGQESNGYYLSDMCREQYWDIGIDKHSGHLSFENYEDETVSKVYALFKLDNPADQEVFQVMIDGNTCDEKGCIEFNLLKGWENEVPWECTIYSASKYIGRKFSWTISLYASKNDLTTLPVASFSGSYEVIELPWIEYQDRIVGDVGTSIPFSISIEGKGFTGATDMKLTFDKMDSVKIASTSGTLEEDDRSYILPISKLSSQNTFSFTLTSEKEISGKWFSFRLYKGDEVIKSESFRMMIPYLVSVKDSAGLMKIALDNNNPVIEKYVKNKEWLLNSDGGKIYTYWYNVSPDRLRRLELTNWQDSLTTLDVTPFDSLKYLTIGDCHISSLDVSMLPLLESVNLWDIKISSLSALTLPKDRTIELSGYTYIEGLGTPLDDYMCEMTGGDTLDLSAYIEDESVYGKTYFTWYEGNKYPETRISLDSIKQGVYILPAALDYPIYCTVHTEKYPNFNFRTKEIRLVRGNINYSQDDIALLKALAKANPESIALQQFVADSVKGWEEPWLDFWEDRNRRVAVDWNMENPARISKLRLREMQGEITSLDLSGFTELEYLDCAALNTYKDQTVKINTLDLSKNTKLTYLDLESCRLDSLDLSKNTNLKDIYLNGNNLTTLDLSNQTDLVFLNVGSNSKLSKLIFSEKAKSSLTSLKMWSCGKISGLDLTEFTGLKSLDIRSTDAAFVDIAVNPPATITELFCNWTDAELLDFSKYPNIYYYGVPTLVDTLDISNARNLYRLDMDGTRVRYSTVKTGGNNRVRFGSNSWITIPGLENINSKSKYLDYRMLESDTIDLSSEAVINGVASTYRWVDETSSTFVDDVFVPVEGMPGKFVYSGKGSTERRYYCFIINRTYNPEEWCEPNSSRSDRWNLRTGSISVEKAKSFDQEEVEALNAIINHINDAGLTKWWKSGAWKTDKYLYSEYKGEQGFFSMEWWMDKMNVYHLANLMIAENKSLKELDASAFTELRDLHLFGNPNLTTLSVQNCNNLEQLHCSRDGFETSLTSVTLPKEKTVLTYLSINGADKLTELDLTGYTNLETIDLGMTYVDPIDLSDYKRLWNYKLPLTTTELDLTNVSEELIVNLDGSQLKFSTVKITSGKTYNIGDVSFPEVKGVRKDIISLSNKGMFDIPCYAVAIGERIDLSSEQIIDGKTTEATGYIVDRFTRERKELSVTYDEKGFLSINNGQPNDQFVVILTNETFPYWAMEIRGHIYTTDGDANLDTKVDVRDVVVTANHIVKDSVNMLPDSLFGFNQADVTYNQVIDVTDIQGIINLILGKPVTKASDLRASVPNAELTVENGILYMNAEVPVAAVQFEIANMAKAEPLLGKAATFTQVSTVGETVRIVGYSLSGTTIPAGKTPLMKWQDGATLVDAVLSDSDALALNVITKGMPTANEHISMTAGTPDILNYPNPFQGTTTLVYHLSETVDEAYVQVFALNGALVDVVKGLDIQVGENRYVYTTRLTAGTYFYRLATRKQGVITYSKSNLFMIK